MRWIVLSVLLLVPLRGYADGEVWRGWIRRGGVSGVDLPRRLHRIRFTLYRPDLDGMDRFRLHCPIHKLWCPGRELPLVSVAMDTKPLSTSMVVTFTTTIYSKICKLFSDDARLTIADLGAGLVLSGIFECGARPNLVSIGNFRMRRLQ